MPSWSPNGRKIVFASNRARPTSGIDQLYVMKADGRGVRQLTHSALAASEPSFSPDGKRIVYTASVLDSSGDQSPGNEEPNAIETISAEGTNRRLLTRGLKYAYRPTWAPDGRWIAFIGHRNSPGPHDPDLYVVRPDGRGLHRLAINIDTPALAWSPDSKEIAFTAGNGQQLHRVPVSAIRPVRLVGRLGAKLPGSSVRFADAVTTDIAWSPDGSKIAGVMGTTVVSGGSIDVEYRRLWINDLKNHQMRLLRPIIDTNCLLDSGVTITWLRGRRPRLAVFAGKRTDILSANGRRTLGSLRPPNRGFLAAGSASPGGSRVLFVDSPSDCGAIYFDDPAIAAIHSAIYVADLKSRRVRQLTRG